MDNKTINNYHPLVSVVIPVCNKASSLRATINSVCQQSYKNFEIIIVLDPSEDGSEDVVDQLRLSNVRTFKRSEKGPGGYAARNLGAQQAEGEWIAFIDADDYWHPKHLQLLVQASNQHTSCKFFATKFDEIDEHSDTIEKNSDTLSACSTNGGREVTFNEFLLNQPFFTSCVLVSRSLMMKVGGFPAGKMKRGGDVDAWLRCVERAGSYVQLDCVTAFYNRSGPNMVTKANFYYEEELRANSLDDLIVKYQGTPTEKSLKLRKNNLFTYAWGQNQRLGISRNFSLLRNIHIEAANFKVVIICIISVIPSPINHWLFAALLRITGR